jgi:hypothetical protein
MVSPAVAVIVWLSEVNVGSGAALAAIGIRRASPVTRARSRIAREVVDFWSRVFIGVVFWVGGWDFMDGSWLWDGLAGKGRRGRNA